MTCDEARALFSDVADARLAPAERAAWDAHLATCVDCRREWAGFQRTLGLFLGLPRHRAPAGFVERVMAAAYPESRPRRLAWRLFVPLRVKLPLEAAALVLVALGAVYLVQRTPEMQQAMQNAAPTPSSPQPMPAVPQPETAPPQPVPAASQPAGPGKKALGALTKPGSEARADLQKAAAETAPEKPAESGSVQAQRYTAPKEAREAASAPETPAPEARAPSRDIPQGRVARQERAHTTAAVAPAVMGRLAVEDRDAAERALAALIARVGATEVRRTPAEDGLLVELDVPRAEYVEFTRGLAGIGGWTPREDRVGSGAEVRVRVIVVRPPAR